MAGPAKPNWVKLVSGTPGLVTNTPAISLAEDQTPDATGLDITTDGFLKQGTQPTGTTRVQKEYTISAAKWYLHYRRLWKGSGTQILYNAPEYTTVVLKQGKGWIDCTQDSGAVLIKPIPIGTGGLIFFKGTGAYILPNADNLGGNFGNPKFIQSAHLSDISFAAELDGLVYFANDDGFLSIDVQGNIDDISLPIRGDVTAAAITVDYENKYINIGDVLTYDVTRKKFFKYATDTFAFYSRQLHNKDNTVLTVDEIDFEFDKTSTAQGEIKFKTRTETRDWSLENTLTVTDQRDQKQHAHFQIPRDTGISWQLQITSMPSTLKIKNIWVRAEGYTQESRDS